MVDKAVQHKAAGLLCNKLFDQMGKTIDSYRTSHPASPLGVNQQGTVKYLKGVIGQYEQALEWWEDTKANAK